MEAERKESYDQALEYEVPSQYEASHQYLNHHEASHQYLDHSGDINHRVEKYLSNLYDCTSFALNWLHQKTLAIADYINPEGWPTLEPLNAPFNGSGAEEIALQPLGEISSLAGNGFAILDTDNDLP